MLSTEVLNEKQPQQPQLGAQEHRQHLRILPQDLPKTRLLQRTFADPFWGATEVQLLREDFRSTVESRSPRENPSQR